MKIYSKNKILKSEYLTAVSSNSRYLPFNSYEKIIKIFESPMTQSSLHISGEQSVSRCPILDIILPFPTVLREKKLFWIIKEGGPRESKERDQKRLKKKNNQKKDLENHFYGESYCTYSIKSRKQGFKPGPNCNNSDLIPTENRLLPCQKDIFDFIKN